MERECVHRRAAPCCVWFRASETDVYIGGRVSLSIVVFFSVEEPPNIAVCIYIGAHVNQPRCH